MPSLLSPAAKELFPHHTVIFSILSQKLDGCNRITDIGLWKVLLDRPNSTAFFEPIKFHF